MDVGGPGWDSDEKEENQKSIREEGKEQHQKPYSPWLDGS